MISHYKYLFIFYLSVHLFSTALSEVMNDSGISDWQDKEANVTLESAQMQLFLSENKSIYDRRQCDCGPHASGCIYSGDLKVCFCEDPYVPKSETCVECDCGFNFSCYFINDEKFCRCDTGYAQHEGRCERCGCGNHSFGCTFENGEKSCRCYYGYAFNGDKCEECDCGRNGIRCNFEHGRKKCECRTNYAQNINGECEKCDCGYSKDCNFNGYTKECSCYDNYIYEYFTGKCERCDCGPNSNSCRLTTDKYTRCTCKPGFTTGRTKWGMDETCERITTITMSGWRIATYIEASFFSAIIVLCICRICCKKVP